MMVMTVMILVTANLPKAVIFEFASGSMYWTRKMLLILAVIPVIILDPSVVVQS
jgi:hypothetical protein